MALMIGCIWHGLDALQGTRAKPGNHLVQYKIGTTWRPYITRKDDKEDQLSDGETIWTNTGATRYGRGKHNTG